MTKLATFVLLTVVFVAVVYVQAQPGRNSNSNNRRPAPTTRRPVPTTRRRYPATTTQAPRRRYPTTTQDYRKNNRNSGPSNNQRNCAEARDLGETRSGVSAVTRWYYYSRTNTCKTFRYKGMFIDSRSIF